MFWNFFPLNLLVPIWDRAVLNLFLWPLWLLSLPFEIMWNLVPNALIVLGFALLLSAPFIIVILFLAALIIVPIISVMIFVVVILFLIVFIATFAIGATFIFLFSLALIGGVIAGIGIGIYYATGNSF